METTEKTFFANVGQYIQKSVTLKLITIFILMMLLLIPVQFIIELINERELLRQSAIMETGNQWGKSQKIYGLIMTLPYIENISEDGKLKEIKNEAHFLPSHLNITGDLHSRKLTRGIYDLVVYDSDITVSGNFSELNKYLPELSDAEILWEDAFLTIGIPDLRGIKEKIVVDWNKRDIPVESGTRIAEIIPSGITTSRIFNGFPDSEIHEFSFDLHLQGSMQFDFIPSGRETSIQLKSDWPHPNFTGAFLPVHRSVNEEGFEASWKVIELNRNYPQFWTGNQYYNDIQNSSFGVELMVPVNEYQKSMRSAKYALLIIALTFLTIFLTEVFLRISIHPFQYILVGLALVLFYTLLISISEYIRFDLTYLIAAITIISITGLYAGAIMKNKKQSLKMVLILTSTYTFIYVILQLQDYALLIGSIGLTVILAFTMYVTRHINWYNLNAENRTTRSAR